MESLRVKSQYIGCGRHTLRFRTAEKGGTKPLRPPNLNLTALTSRAGGARQVFVGARAVQPGHRNIQQPEVHAELRAMMNEMVHHDTADDGHARHRENLLATGKKLPRFQ